MRCGRKFVYLWHGRNQNRHKETASGRDGGGCTGIAVEFQTVADNAIATGIDGFLIGQKSQFTSVDDQAAQAIGYAKEQLNGHLDVAYGLSSTPLTKTTEPITRTLPVSRDGWKAMTYTKGMNNFISGTDILIDGGTTASYWYGDLQYLKQTH